MTVEVSQLQVKVSSDGIKEATDGLNSLVKAATAAESKSVILKSATEGVSKANGASAKAADKLIKKYKQAVDLLGANTEETFRYVAAAKGLSADQVELAGRLGAQVDAYKQLIIQQREAVAAARAEAKAQEALTKAHGEAIEMNKKYDAAAQAAAQREVNAELRAAAKAEEDLARAQGQAIEMNKRYDRKKRAQEWRELGVAQAEAIRMNKQMDAANAATAATTARVEKQQRDFIATLKEQAETANMTASQLIAYRAAQLGVTDQAAPFIKRMQDLESGVNKAGISAKQTAFAFKMLPAQFSDISVQLAGGQNPFLVLLQQGSQIKDSFGGIGPTFKAFAEALTPVRLALGGTAVAVGLVGLALYQNMQLVTDFNKQMILTGGYAGITTDQFIDMSKSISQIAGSKNNAAKALTEIASSGLVASENIKSVGEAAVTMQKLTGQSVEKTISQFAAIQKDPVDAVVKLNDQYHFLTLSVFEQVQALERQGEHEQAVKVAWEAFVSSMKERTPQVLENANAIERAWDKIKTSISKAWDSIGATDSTEEKIKKLQDRIEFNKQEAKTFGGPNQKAVDNANEILQSQIDLLKFNEQLNTAVQNRANAEAKINKDGIDAAKKIREELDKIKGGDKLNKDLQNAKKLYEDLYAGNAGVSEEKRSELLKGVVFKDGSPVSGGGYQALVDEYKRKDLRKTPTNEYGIDAQLKQLQGTIDEEKRLLDRNNVANKNAYDVGIINLKEYLANDYDLRAESLREQKALVEEQIKIAQGKKNLAAVEKYKNDLSKIQDEIYKNGEDYNAKVKKADAEEKARIENYLEGLSNVVENRRKEIENMSIGAGMGDRQREDMKRALKIQEEYQAQLQALNKKFPIKEARDNSTEYQTELAGLKKQLDDRLTLEQKYKDDRVKLESDWQAGASDAWQNYLDSTKDVAGQTKTLFTQAFSGLEDALTNFVMTGKLSFGDFAKSVIAQIIKIQLASASTGIFGSLFSGVTSIFGKTTGASGLADSSNLAGAFAANGAVFDNGASTRYFADGGAFTNGIVSSPTNFDIGQMGEAGPEAIVPLTKTSDGSLGVTMKGVGASGDVSLVQHISIDAGGSASVSTSSNDINAASKEFANTIAQVARQEIARQQKQGGSIWKMVNSQRG